MKEREAIAASSMTKSSLMVALALALRDPGLEETKKDMWVWVGI